VILVKHTPTNLARGLPARVNPARPKPTLPNPLLKYIRHPQSDPTFPTPSPSPKTYEFPTETSLKAPFVCSHCQCARGTAPGQGLELARENRARPTRIFRKRARAARGRFDAAGHLTRVKRGTARTARALAILREGTDEQELRETPETARQAYERGLGAFADRTRPNHSLPMRDVPFTYANPHYTFTARLRPSTCAFAHAIETRLASKRPTPRSSQTVCRRVDNDRHSTRIPAVDAPEETWPPQRSRGRSRRAVAAPEEPWPPQRNA
jgi:hypothetical protein